MSSLLFITVAVSAAFEKSVLNARARIQEIVERSSVPFNYFISLPLIDQTIKDRVLAFHKLIPAEVDRTLLGTADRLHFTIVMLKLYGNDAIERAKLHLASLQRQVYDLVGTRSTVVKLQGLHVFENANPTAADVVFTQPSHETAPKIQELAGTLQWASDLGSRANPESHPSQIFYATPS